MSIQRQETEMLALCAQILIWVSVSGEKAPGKPNLAIFLKVTNLSALGDFSQDALTHLKI